MRHLLLASAFLLVPMSVLAQERALPPVTRTDLAIATIRFEEELAAHAPAAAKIAELNRAFDRASMAYISGEAADAVRQINELAIGLRTGADPTPAQILAASLRVRMDPPVCVYKSGAPTTVLVASLYEVSLPKRTTLSIVVRGPDGEIAGEAALAVDPSSKCVIDTAVPIAPKKKKEFEPATYQVSVQTPDGVGIPAIHWSVVKAHPGQTRRENEAALAGVRRDSPPLEAAAEAFASRNRLLTSLPKDTDLTVFLTDPNVLMPNLTEELRILLKGQDPYQNLEGLYWRTATYKGEQVPFWVYAPKAISQGAAMPLIVMLHGAGSDENAFMFGSGGPAARKLAEKLGFIVVAPFTTPIAKDPRIFDGILEAVRLDYRIDPKRVYLLGHALGAGVASTIATQRPGQVAALYCIAGGGFVPTSGEKVPPARIAAGELDTVVPPRTLEAAAQMAANAGLPVTYELVPDYGHTLIVAHQMPLAIKWLLGHKPKGK